MHGENQHSRLRNASKNLVRGFQAVQVRHSNIENHDIGPELQSLFYRLSPIASLSADFPSTMAFD